MQSVAKIVSAKLVTYFEQREEAESNNVAILTKFNSIALSLVRQMNASLGLQDYQLLEPLLESGADTVCRQLNEHVLAHEKEFYYQDTSFFSKGPIIPVNKVSTLSASSEAAVWKFIRRLYYLSKQYLANSPLGSLPYADFIRKLLPANFQLNRFLKEQCEKAADNPHAALSAIMEMTSSAMEKSGMSPDKLASLAKTMVAQHVPSEELKNIAPLIKTLETKVNTIAKVAALSRKKKENLKANTDDQQEAQVSKAVQVKPEPGQSS